MVILIKFGLKAARKVLWHNCYTMFLCLKCKHYVTIWKKIIIKNCIFSTVGSWKIKKYLN